MPKFKQELLRAPADDVVGAPAVDADAVAAAAAATVKAEADAAEAAENSFDVSGDFWSTQNKETETKPETQTVVIQQTDAPVSEEDAFNNHVAAQDFGDLVMSEEQVQAFMQNGDVAGLQAGVTTMMQAAYGKILKDAGKLITNQKADIIKAAKAEMQGLSDANANVSALNTALPFTSQAAIKPVADSVLTQAMSNGKTLEQGIETVRQFFSETAKLGASELKLDLNNDAPGSQGFNAGNGDGSVIEDWAAFLAPPIEP